MSNPYADEPPEGSAVRDRDGDLWVHLGASWDCVPADELTRLWPNLVRHFGPLRLMVDGPVIE